MMRRLLALGLCAAPAIALACPACARDSLGPAGYAMIGSLLLLPFGIAGVVVAAIRRVERDERHGSEA